MAQTEKMTTMFPTTIPSLFPTAPHPVKKHEKRIKSLKKTTTVEVNRAFFVTPDDALVLKHASDRPRKMDSVRYINLSSQHLRLLGSVLRCSQLRMLYLHSNYVESLEGLDACPNLALLDLHNNHVEKLPGPEFWSKLVSLRALYLHGNAMGNLKNVQGLAFAPRLTIVTLYDTPVALHPNYRHFLINTLLGLKALDFYAVSDEEIIEDAAFGGRFSAMSPTFRLDTYLVPSGRTSMDSLAGLHRLLWRISYMCGHNSPIVCLQASMRGWLVRRDYRLYIRVMTWVALTIQRTYRKHAFRRRCEARRLRNLSEAAPSSSHGPARPSRATVKAVRALPRVRVTRDYLTQMALRIQQWWRTRPDWAVKEQAELEGQSAHIVELQPMSEAASEAGVAIEGEQQQQQQQQQQTQSHPLQQFESNVVQPSPFSVDQVAYASVVSTPRTQHHQLIGSSTTGLAEGSPKAAPVEYHGMPIDMEHELHGKRLQYFQNIIERPRNQQRNNTTDAYVPAHVHADAHGQVPHGATQQAQGATVMRQFGAPSKEPLTLGLQAALQGGVSAHDDGPWNANGYPSADAQQWEHMQYQQLQQQSLPYQYQLDANIPYAGQQAVDSYLASLNAPSAAYPPDGPPPASFGAVDGSPGVADGGVHVRQERPDALPNVNPVMIFACLEEPTFLAEIKSEREKYAGIVQRPPLFYSTTGRGGANRSSGAPGVGGMSSSQVQYGANDSTTMPHYANASAQMQETMSPQQHPQQEEHQQHQHRVTFAEPEYNRQHGGGVADASFTSGFQQYQYYPPPANQFYDAATGAPQYYDAYPPAPYGVMYDIHGGQQHYDQQQVYLQQQEELDQEIGVLGATRPLEWNHPLRSYVRSQRASGDVTRTERELHKLKLARQEDEYSARAPEIRKAVSGSPSPWNEVSTTRRHLFERVQATMDFELLKKAQRIRAERRVRDDLDATADKVSDLKDTTREGRDKAALQIQMRQRAARAQAVATRESLDRRLRDKKVEEERRIAENRERIASIKAQAELASAERRFANEFVRHHNSISKVVTQHELSLLKDGRMIEQKTTVDALRAKEAEAKAKVEKHLEQRYLRTRMEIEEERCFVDAEVGRRVEESKRSLDPVRTLISHRRRKQKELDAQRALDLEALGESGYIMEEYLRQQEQFANAHQPPPRAPLHLPAVAPDENAVQMMRVADDTPLDPDEAFESAIKKNTMPSNFRAAFRHKLQQSFSIFGPNKRARTPPPVHHSKPALLRVRLVRPALEDGTPAEARVINVATGQPVYSRPPPVEVGESAEADNDAVAPASEWRDPGPPKRMSPLREAVKSASNYGADELLKMLFEGDDVDDGFVARLEREAERENLEMDLTNMLADFALKARDADTREEAIGALLQTAAVNTTLAGLIRAAGGPVSDQLELTLDLGGPPPALYGGGGRNGGGYRGDNDEEDLASTGVGMGMYGDAGEDGGTGGADVESVRSSATDLSVVGVKANAVPKKQRE